ncbi:hypothetical protein [Telluribacter sp.]|jgi:hypothetical protein|uniref:hypothetical protein n=1 Tax=Telluribacter sp. TaxID=1978767 RepID=UPI002E15458E|nr:hypothetical protein [Telluribacter sp.]
MPRSTYFLLIPLLLGACQGSQQNQSAEKADATGSYCFGSTFPTDAPPDRQDVTELRWEVAPDGSVSGVYNRLPLEKDSRKGTLRGNTESGHIDGFVVHATYTYQQEGTQSEEKINIIVRGDQAIVLPDGEFVWVNGVAYPREMGLADTLQRVDCKKIKGQ